MTQPMALAPVGAGSADQPVRRRIALPNTEQRDLIDSRGLTYRLLIAYPIGDPPSPAGYPVLYVLDGNAAFTTVAAAVSLRSRRRETSGIAPAIVVGVGYPTDEPFDMTRRSLDYTPPAAIESLPARPDGSLWPPVGGADRFLDFLADTVLPAIAHDFPVDPARQCLFGHSFGGLFALHALLNRPTLFGAYMAASPSLWWNDRAILRELPRFVARAKTQAFNARLFVCVGSLEQELTAVEAAADDSEQRSRWKTGHRMLDNAREFVAGMRLASLPQVQFTYEEFADEDHMSVIPSAIGRAVTFGLGWPNNPDEKR